MKWILGWLSRCLMRWGKVVGVDCYTIYIEDYDKREARGMGITPLWVMSVSERTITRYIRDGLLPVVRLGSVVRIRREDIDELLKTHLEVTQ